MNASELLQRGAQVVIAGERGAGDTRALFEAAIRAPAVARVVTVVEPGTELPEDPPRPRQGQGRRTRGGLCVRGADLLAAGNRRGGTRGGDGAGLGRWSGRSSLPWDR